jgi:hypothetical protein
MKLSQHGRLLIALHDQETREEAGWRLKNPAELFVSIYDEENDRWSVEPISWGAANALAPHDVASLTEWVKNERYLVKEK